jgi:hypothetical protein
MNVANVTVIAINHGLMLVCGAGTANTDLGAMWTVNDGRAVRVSLMALVAQLDA